MQIEQEIKGVLTRWYDFFSSSQSNRKEEFSPNCPSVAGGDGLCLWPAKFGVYLSYWFSAQHPKIFCSIHVQIVFFLWLVRVKFVVDLTEWQARTRLYPVMNVTVLRVQAVCILQLFAV